MVAIVIIIVIIAIIELAMVEPEGQQLVASRRKGL